MPLNILFGVLRHRKNPAYFGEKHSFPIKHFKISSSQMARDAFNVRCPVSAMVGELFETSLSQTARNALKLSIMVGENYDVSSSQMTKKGFNWKCIPWLEKILKFPRLKRVEIHSNCPSWLEKKLKFIRLKWLKMHLIESVHHGWENVEISSPQTGKNTLKMPIMVRENNELSSS